MGLSIPSAPPFLPGLFEGLLLHASGGVILLDADGQGVFAASEQTSGDVEPAAHETTFHPPESFAIQEDVRLPVNPAEVQPGVLTLG